MNEAVSSIISCFQPSYHKTNPPTADTQNLNMESDTEIIDLTHSFTYCRAQAPVHLSNSIIVLDDSIDNDIVSQAVNSTPPAAPTVNECVTDDIPAINISGPSQPKKPKATKRKRQAGKQSTAVRERSPHIHFGDCPICRDPLGTRPLASTKCGHVYCISCIEESMKIVKKCPTCRKPLKGSTAFHPLFLSV